MTGVPPDTLHGARVLCTGASGFIGTHLVPELIGNGASVLNLDLQEPISGLRKENWQRCDILDGAGLTDAFAQFSPTHVVHLAARTTLVGQSLDEFRENTDGTANLLAAVRETKSVRRTVITSTQHVRKPGAHAAVGDWDYEPYLLYGESKVITEKLTRQSSLEGAWTIIRPTTVWGPWHVPFANGLWRVMSKGLYLHPRGVPVLRSYGYVGNVVFQLMKILNAPREIVDKRVYYVGERPIEQGVWVDAFSRALTGKASRLASPHLLWALARFGDICRRCGINAPIYTERYRNMTTSNIVPLDPTYHAFGEPPYGLDEAVGVTVEWLRKYPRFQ